MKQPGEFLKHGYEHLVCRFKRLLYGLKQAPRELYKRFDSYMIKIGYKWCEPDCFIYVKSFDNSSFVSEWYVDCCKEYKWYCCFESLVELGIWDEELRCWKENSWDGDSYG